MGPIILSALCPRVEGPLGYRVLVLPGWRDEEAGEGQDLAGRLPGVQWLCHLSGDCAYHSAEPRGAAEGSTEYSLEGLMNLKLQCFGLLMRRANSLVKTLMLEKTEGR